MIAGLTLLLAVAAVAMGLRGLHLQRIILMAQADIDARVARVEAITTRVAKIVTGTTAPDPAEDFTALDGALDALDAAVTAKLPPADPAEQPSS